MGEGIDKSRCVVNIHSSGSSEQSDYVYVTGTLWIRFYVIKLFSLKMCVTAVLSQIAKVLQ